METLIKIDSSLLEKAMLISNNKSEKLIAEEALRNYILMNNIFNKTFFEPQIFNNTSNNSEIINDYLELIEKNKKEIKKINKNIDLSNLANEVNNDLF